MACLWIVALPAITFVLRRLGEQKLLACAFFLTANCSLFVPFLTNVVALSVVSFAFGFGMGCGLPLTTMMMFSSSPQGRSGETLGLRQKVNNRCASGVRRCSGSWRPDSASRSAS